MITVQLINRAEAVEREWQFPLEAGAGALVAAGVGSMVASLVNEIKAGEALIVRNDGTESVWPPEENV